MHVVPFVPMRRLRTTCALLVAGALLGGCRIKPPASVRASAPVSIHDQARHWTTPPPPGQDILARDSVLLVDDHDPDGFWDQFADDVDGMFDMDKWLASKTGFLPIVSPITEPAVGFGLLGTLAFFHDGDGAASRFEEPAPGQRKAAPNVAAVGGLLTENETWGAFAGYMGNWRNDTIRYTGALGYASVNLKFYGIASELLDDPAEFNIEGAFTLHDLSFRVAESDFFVGVRYEYADMDVEGPDLLGLGLRLLDFSAQNAALGATVRYDTRDNTFTPNRGVYAELSYMRYDTDVGGDYDYDDFEFVWTAWTPLASCLNLGVRLRGEIVDGDPPFWGRPFIDLRGIPAMRYQGDDILVGETELRWDLNGRWSLVGFTGAGRAGSSVKRLFERDERTVVDTAWNVGAGFRYLIARKLGLRMGIDVARGPEDWALYITTGNAWTRF